MPIRVISPQKESAGIVLFYKASSPFSNFHPAEFIVETGGESKSFNCSEQYFMYQKALSAGDRESGERILKMTKPLLMKRAGRKLEMDTEMLKKWSSDSLEVMYKGCLEKFSQNEELRLALLRTRGMLIAEASHRDKLWGIGLSVNDKRAENSKTWHGSNKLGKILERIRDELWEKEEFRRDKDLVESEAMETRYEKLKKLG